MSTERSSLIDRRSLSRDTVSKGSFSPLVSIVLPTHNRPLLLKEAVDSVVAQNVSGWELLIVDDGSNPPVNANDFPDPGGRIRVHRNNESQGGAASKALGTELATGEFVTYLDDDDLYAPDFLSTATAVFEQFPDLDVLFIGVEWFGQNAVQEAKPHLRSLEWVLAHTTTTRSETQVLLLGEDLFDSLLEKVPMPFQRPFVRRSKLDGIGLHEHNCLLWDCDWALRAALHARCALVPRPLYRQRAAEQGYYSRSGTHAAQATSELEIARRLYRDSKSALQDSGKTRVLRRSIGRRAHQLAYVHAGRGEVIRTLVPWFIGQWFAPSWLGVRTLVAAIYRAFPPLHTRNKTTT